MHLNRRLGARGEAVLPQGRIRYREAGAGEPILFLHGFMTNGSLWRRVVPGLAGEFRCVTPDWPLGSHAQPMAADADLSPRGLVSLIVGFLDEIGVDAATLVGIDVGGALCQMAAAEHPGRISRMVLLPSGPFSPMVFHYLRAAPRGVAARSGRRLPAAFGWAAKRPIDAVAADAYVYPFTAIEGVRRDAMRVIAGLSGINAAALTERMRSFRPPVLIVWPPEDRLYPFQRAVELSTAFPNARLEPVEDSYTYVPEDQPGRLTSLMLDFMGEGAQSLSPVHVIGV